jgi:hypothetical protein
MKPTVRNTGCCRLPLAAEHGCAAHTRHERAPLHVSPSVSCKGLSLCLRHIP